MKIAICTPHFREVHAKFMTSLLEMVVHTNTATIVFNGEPIQPEVRLFTRTGSVVAALRNALLNDAMGWDANYLLWLDSDHAFPSDALLRLLSHNLPVVGVNYPRRCYPTYPTAMGFDLKPVWTTRELAEQGAVEPIAALGFGVCLLDMTILSGLHQTALAAGRESIWPLFAHEIIPGSMNVGGEDAFFFARLHEAGIKAYVDHSLSWQVTHLHEAELTNADTVAQKDLYLEGRPPSSLAPRHG